MSGVLAFVLVFVLGARRTAGAQGEMRADTITVGGVVRDYIVYRAPGSDSTRPAPLLLFFHGGGGSAKGAAERYGFNESAGAAGAVVVYPDGVDHHWADARGIYHEADDYAFIEALVRRLVARFRIDPRRVFAAGHSNGAIFANSLACRQHGVFAAIGTVAGSMPTNDVAQCGGASPISVIAIHGTKDPLAHYEGGVVARKNGEIIGAERSIGHWAAIDSCAATPARTALPPLDKDDPTRVVRLDFPGCRGGRAVLLYSIEGAGHNWPGAAQQLPQLIVGPNTHQLDATRVIWDFFMAHPAP